MSQFDDEEEKVTLLKREKRPKKSIMRGNVNLQHALKLLEKQKQKHQRPKEKSISPRSNIISPKQKKGIKWAKATNMAQKGTTISSAGGTRGVDARSKLDLLDVQQLAPIQ
jgi:hypothetical protein